MLGSGSSHSKDFTSSSSCASWIPLISGQLIYTLSSDARGSRQKAPSVYFVADIYAIFDRATSDFDGMLLLSGSSYSGWFGA